MAWLDAGPAATSGSSYLIIPAGSEERVTANVARLTVTEHRDGVETQRSGDIFTELRARWTPPSGVTATAQFTGGWVGWFGYECAATTLDISVATESDAYPDAAWFRAGAWARFEHDRGTLAIDGCDESAIAHLTAALDAPASPSSGPRGVVARWRDEPNHYAHQVAAAQRLIADGETYQLCFTSRVSGAEQIDPVATYLALRQSAPSHHGSLIRIGDTALASASPEQFLQLTPNGGLSSKPIKGTRRRAADAVTDAALASELHTSEKERAENVMIVDLMRNDLGRVAVTGSVSVPSLLAVESYAPVHQLVSTVTAQLDPNVHPVDAIASAFPAGSMTGAPKHRAVTRLQELESGPRGIYSGAHGYLSEDGSIDLAMTIRTIVCRPDGWSIGAGGGITALSVPVDEVAEAHLKAAALLTVLGATNPD